MVLVIDNYDSFTYNLVQILGELGAETLVARNDAITLERARSLDPDGLVISPGPGRPGNAGVSIPFILEFGPIVPTLGVCLGHQAIGEAFGAEVVQARHIRHGKTSSVGHDGEGLLAGTPQDFTATRYHSLVIDQATLPHCLRATAWSTDDGELMGVRHREYPIEGVQFHPESILTEAGRTILANFVAMTREGRRKAC